MGAFLRSFIERLKSSAEVKSVRASDHSSIAPWTAFDSAEAWLSRVLMVETISARVLGARRGSGNWIGSRSQGFLPKLLARGEKSSHRSCFGSTMILAIASTLL